MIKIHEMVIAAVISAGVFYAVNHISVGGKIYGIVTDEYGQALPGVLIAVDYPNNIIATYTDASGKYNLSKLQEGYYPLVFILAGYNSQSYYIPITKNESYELNVVMS